MPETLIDQKLFAPLVEMLAGERVVILCPPGNVGDLLIHEGTRYLLNEHEVEHTFYPLKELNQIPKGFTVWCWGGGGNISGRYGLHNYLKQAMTTARAHKAKFIVLPQTLEWPCALLREAHYCFLREHMSLKMCQYFSNVTLVPDLALAHPIVVDDYPKPIYNEGVFLRNDSESVKTQASEEFIDPAKTCISVTDYFSLASLYKHITTDRLHFAVASMLLKRQVTLCNNDYHKNQSFCSIYKEIPGKSVL